MNVTMQKTDSVSARLTVSVEENDYKDKVIKDLKTIGRTHQIPGFRKGHISIADLQRRFGNQVTSDVINREAFEAVMKFIEDNKLEVLGQPMPVEMKAIDFKTDKEFTFEYDLALAPELNITLDKSEHIPYYNIEVTDAMIDEQDKAFCKRFGAQVPGEEVEPDALVKGAIMELNPDGTVKESDDAIQVINGIVAPMYFKSKEETDKFIGKKVGDKVTFNPHATCNGDLTEMASMLQIEKDRAANVIGDFEMAISEIIVVRPAEHNEEFYTNVFGADKVHNEDEYRAALKDMIAGELKSNSEMIFRFSCKNLFMSKYGEMELPAAILKKWMISRDEKLNEENVDEEYERVSSDLKWQLIKEKIAVITGMKVEEEDLNGLAKSIAARQFAQYGMTNLDDTVIGDYAKRMLEDKNYRSRIIEQAGDIKLFAAIENAVTLDEKTVSLDEFKEIASKL